MPSLYEQVGGFDQILALTRRWHELCIQDPVAAHPFEHGMHPFHDERLAAYFTEAFGGPKLYSAGYGDESTVRRTHACNEEHLELDDACIRLFDQAIDDVGIVGEPKQQVSSYFKRMIGVHHELSVSGASIPDGLPIDLA